MEKVWKIRNLYQREKGGFQERRIITKMFLLILRSLLITTQGSYDIVVKVWKLGSYIKVEGG